MIIVYSSCKACYAGQVEGPQLKVHLCKCSGVQLCRYENKIIITLMNCRGMHSFFFVQRLSSLNAVFILIMFVTATHNQHP
jgi:hypothetical protein